MSQADLDSFVLERDILLLQKNIASASTNKPTRATSLCFAEAMAQRRTIADFNLVWSTSTSFEDLRLDFVQPYVGDASARDWKFCRITHPDNSDLRFTYAVCLCKDLFVLFDANLTNGRDPSDRLYRRYTEMRVWELLVDCWANEAQANINSLRWIGINDVVNVDIRKVIRREIETQVSMITSKTSRIIIASDSITWRANYFTRAAGRAAGALSKRVAKVTYSCVDTSVGARYESVSSQVEDTFLEMNMILELEQHSTR